MHEELESGVSYNWLASDTFGHVALFVSGSFARVPNAFSGDLQRFEMDVRPLVDAVIDTFPLISNYELGPKPSVHDQIRTENSLWQHVAKQGLYVFDAASHLKDFEYYLTFVPDNPICAEQLEGDLAKLATEYRVSFCFEEKPLITQLEAIGLYN